MDTSPTPSGVYRVYAALIGRAAVPIILLGIVLAAASVWYASRNLGFQANRTDLLSRDIPWNQRFIDWFEHFPGANDLMIVVASDPDDRERREAALAFIDDLVPALEADPDIGDVEWGASATEFSPKAVRLAPMTRFEHILEEVIMADRFLLSDTPGLLIADVNKDIVRTRRIGRGDDADPEAIRDDIVQLADLVTAIGESMRDPDDADSILGGLLEDPASQRWLYLVSPSGKLVFVLASPRVEEGTVNASQRAIAATRRVIAEVRADHPGVEVGLTGTEVVDSDETVVATFDASLASAISLAMIAVLLVIGFHSFRMPVVLLTALLIGVAWSLGWVVLSVGHLQVLSVVFIAVLLGLGVDFGIHLDSTYEHVRREHPDGPEHFAPSLAETMRLSAPGILTGAITTAAAFLTTAFTDFLGVAEMGIIAAGGVVLCLISMFTVFPALLRLFRSRHRQVQPLEDRRYTVFREQWIMPVSRRPKTTLAVAALVSVVAGWFAWRVEFVYDLLALQPEGVESVTWQERVIRDGGASIYFGVSITDRLLEAFERQEAFQKLPSVAAVGGIGLLNPPDGPEKITLIETTRARIEPALDHAMRIPTRSDAARSTSALTTELAFLERAVGDATSRGDVPPAVRNGLLILKSALGDTLAVIRGVEVRERVRRVDVVNAAWGRVRRDLARRLDDLLDPFTLLPEDFPAGIMRPFVDWSDPTRRRFCLHVYPQLPDDPDITNPLAPEFLPGFVEDLESVDPDVTGVVVQIQRSGELIWSSYKRAGLLALAVVFVLVWIVFRRIGDTVLAMLPVLLGFLVTFGVMGVAGVYLNPANLMVLPLLFGIGVDAGVHVVHRYRLNPTRRPIGMTFGTGKGITITSLTTMFGFATMMLARHRGVSSLGFVMTVGLAVTTLVCWTVLPALLELRQRARERKSPDRTVAGEA